MWWNLFSLYCFITKVHALIGRNTLTYIYRLHDNYRYVFISFLKLFQYLERGWIDIRYECNKGNHKTDNTTVLVCSYRHWWKLCILFIVAFCFFHNFQKIQNSRQQPMSLFSSRFAIKEAQISYSGKCMICFPVAIG